MTREEAIEELERLLRHWDLIDEGIYDLSEHDQDAVEMALSALRPVSREQVEKVYPGCPMCENGLPKIHIPAFQALAICNQHMNHEAFDIELNSKFCLNCGRPLTDEAVDMVMERINKMEETEMLEGLE